MIDAAAHLVAAAQMLLGLAGAGFLEWLAAGCIVRPAEPGMKAEPRPYLAAVPLKGSY